MDSMFARFFRCLLLLLVLASCSLLSFGQKPVSPAARPPVQNKASDFINIRFSDLFTYELLGLDTLQRLVGHVELNQDSVFLFCDSAVILNNTKVNAKGNFILQHGDYTTIFSDSAEYRGDTKIAELFGNVSLLKGTQKLFTDRLTYNTNTKIATYLTGATMTDDTTFLKSVKGYFHADTDDMFFKDSVVVVSPDFTLRSDTLQFNVSTKLVTFLAPTLIRQDTAKIYTEGGFYDLDKRLAEFTINPQYVKNQQKAWAKVMRYDGNRQEVTLIGDAHFEDTATVATANRIIFNEKTEVTVLQGNAFIKDESRTITGDTVSYDARNETYATRGRSHIVDGAQILDANFVDYDKEKELGIARGDVIWQDTTERLTVLSEFAEHSKKRNYLKASGGKLGRPLLIKVIDSDSLFVSADTLMSVQPEKIAGNDSLINRKNIETPINDSLFAAPPPHDSTNIAVDTSRLFISNADTSNVAINPRSETPNSKSDTTRIILAFHDVRIFKSDLQAICDSLAYSTVDSMFRLYQQPVIWSDTSQFSSDTINMQLANDKLDRIFLRQNSFIINSPDELFFNQIKGKNSIAFFDSSEIRRVRVEGNAESVYYPLDDEKAYIGVNKTICSEMLIFFGDSGVEGIKFYAEPKASLTPMKEADHNALKLPGFQWQIERRPGSVEDLFKPKTPVISAPPIENSFEKEGTPEK
jgi:lipopolysaccharide export system protein LptA